MARRDCGWLERRQVLERRRFGAFKQPARYAITAEQQHQPRLHDKGPQGASVAGLIRALIFSRLLSDDLYAPGLTGVADVRWSLGGRWKLDKFLGLRREGVCGVCTVDDNLYMWILVSRRNLLGAARAGMGGKG
jgi:hypothetical protein